LLRGVAQRGNAKGAEKKVEVKGLSHGDGESCCDQASEAREEGRSKRKRTVPRRKSGVTAQKGALSGRGRRGIEGNERGETGQRDDGGTADKQFGRDEIGASGKQIHCSGKGNGLIKGRRGASTVTASGNLS